jgi:hypothetical protein
MPAATLIPWEASGSASLSYAHGNDTAIDIPRAAVAAVYDRQGTLSITVHFTDATYGAAKLALTVPNYLSSIQRYPISRLSVEVQAETSGGAWKSGANSFGLLAIRKTATDAYVGLFNATSLTWESDPAGEGDRPPYRIRSLYFAMSSSGTDVIAVTSTTDGACTLTTQIGTNAAQTSSVPANVSLDYGLTIQAGWNDPSYGQLSLYASLDNNSTGTYSSASTEMMVWVASLTGLWTDIYMLNPCTILNVIATTAGLTTSFIISLSISELPWASQGQQQPALNLSLSAFAVDIGDSD